MTLEVKITIINGMSTIHSLPNKLLKKIYEEGLKDDPSKCLNWVPDHIKRARDSPLHITLDCTRFADLYPVLRLIKPHRERWRSLRILVSHVCNPPSVLAWFTRFRTPKLNGRGRYLSQGHHFPSPPAGIPRRTHPSSNDDSFRGSLPCLDKLRAFFDESPCLERLAIYDDIEVLLKNINPRPYMATIDLRHLKHLAIEAYRVPESADADVAPLSCSLSPG